MTNPVEPSPWQTDCRSVNSTSRVLWSTKGHYRVHKSEPLDYILSHVNQIHALTPYLRSTSIYTSASWVVSSIQVFQLTFFFCIRFSSPAYATCTTHHESPRYAVVYSFLLLHPSYVQIFSSALFSDTVNMCSSYSLTFSIFQLCPLKTKYFPQNFVLKRPQSLFFP
jgi:hypothetical protein